MSTDEEKGKALTEHASLRREIAEARKTIMRIGGILKDVGECIVADHTLQRIGVHPGELTLRPSSRLRDDDLTTLRESIRDLRKWNEEREQLEQTHPELKLA